MIVILTILGAIGFAAMGLVIAKTKEMHDWGYSWGYSFLQVFGGSK